MGQRERKNVKKIKQVQSMTVLLKMQNSNAQPPSCCCHNVAIVTHIRHLGSDGYAVTSSTLLADPPSNETIGVFYINKSVGNERTGKEIKLRDSMTKGNSIKYNKKMTERE